MEASQPPQSGDTPHPVCIIVGFGLPGRFVAEVLDARQLPYVVIELNPSNASSVERCGKRVLCGDARDPAVLRAAGIEHASILALTMPDERAVIDVLHVAKQVNPNVKMFARCNYTSTGIKAEKAGAAAVLVEEQLVALEFAKLMSNAL
jgi:voltage-gated potassium channel Kch